MNRKESPSGIYLLPNLCTTVSLFAAFFSIVASLKAQYESAAIAIFIGMLADGFDGRIARLTNTQTAFGAQYDSLSDLVTFGVAPALLLYSWNLQTLGKIGWLISFIYTAAVALRLARFNTQIGIADKSYFQGLPCPPAAGISSAWVWFQYQHNLDTFIFCLLTAFISIILAMLMVSNIRYYSFKEIDFKGKVPFLYLLFVVFLFVAIAVNPAFILYIGFLIYALSGPLHTLLLIQKRRGQRKNSSNKNKKSLS